MPRPRIVIGLTAACLLLPGTAGASQAAIPTHRPGPVQSVEVPRAGGVADPAGSQRRQARRNPTVRQVIAISVDGLNPSAITRLGARRAPTLTRMLRQGVGTLSARTEYERTETLPNHTGMVTGLRITAAEGGHGVEWNDDRRHPRTVQAAAGRRVPSVFSQVRRSGRSTALFASKTKFRLWQRSWPHAFSKFVITEDNARLVKKFRADLRHPRAFRFLHLSAPDVVGHAEGYMGREYLAQVSRTDALLGTVLRRVRSEQPGAVVILTSDHGGRGYSHADPTLRVNYRVPFVVWGRGIAHGRLYGLNRDNAYARPDAEERVPYEAARQPVRNGAVANLSLDLLGLPALAGSEHDVRQDLLIR